MKVSIDFAFPTDINPSFTYFKSDITVTLSLGRKLKISDAYSFFIYNPQWLLFADSLSKTPQVDSRKRSVTYTMLVSGAWMPGDYFLLVRSDSGKIFRAEVTLTASHTWRVGDLHLFTALSDEGILSNPPHGRHREWRELFTRPGAGQLRRCVVERLRAMQLNALRGEMLESPLRLNYNFILTHKYESDSPSMFLFHRLLGFSQNWKNIDCKKMFDVTSNDPYENLREVTTIDDSNVFDLFKELAEMKVYHLYNLSALNDSHGKIIMGKLLEIMPDANNYMLLDGTRQEVDQLLEQYPSLQKNFPEENRLSMEPFSPEEFFFQLLRAIEHFHITLSEESIDSIGNTVMEAFRRGTLGNWGLKDINHYVRNVVQPAYVRNLTSRITLRITGSTDYRLQPEDVPTEPLMNNYSLYDDAMKQLDSMVGLQSVKQSIGTHSNRMRFYAERKRQGLRTTAQTACHAIFTGNPGTGKTTVARLLGKIYHSLGLLSSGNVITIDRTKVIGRYIGETEENMKLVLEEARGNVLFVDEAYTFYSGDNSNDFGRHVIESLLTVLTQPNPDMLIIFAGYETEMDRLMSMNPGLVGRFPYKYHFDDYSADELMLIAEHLLEQEDYFLSDDARRLLLSNIVTTVKNRTRHFANARWIEHYVHEGIIPALADRVMVQQHATDSAAYQRVEVQDVAKAFERFNPKMIELKPRRQVGFTA